MSSRSFCKLIVAIFAAVSVPACAQVTATAIHGLVRDPSGAIVPGAALRLQDTATGIEKTTVSSADGVFAFSNNSYFQWDMSVNKSIPIKERWRLNFTAVALNVFNHPFFPLANTSPTSSSFGQIAPPASNLSGVRTMQLRGSIEW